MQATPRIGRTNKTHIKSIVVLFEVALLGSEDFRRWGNVESEPSHAFCLTNQRQDLRVKVHIQVIRFGVLDQKRSIQTGLGNLNL